MLITLNQLKKSLQALKNFLLAKIPTKVSDLVDDSGHYTKPSTGIPASDLADGAVPVRDVQTNGTSVLNNGIANVPIASAAILGVVKSSGEGIQIDSSTGDIYTQKANPDDVKAGTNRYKVIVPQNQNEATFYGLAKASGDTTQSASSNAVGTYTDDAKASIKTMLGVEDPVDVQINGTSIVNEGVANIPVAKVGTLGVVYPDNASIAISANGQLKIQDRPLSYYKSGNNSTAVVCSSQHISAFYGLAKAAGDTTQSSSSNAVGTYTDEAKAAIKTMLGIDTITVDSIPTTEIDTLFA